jgi:hypothetical protein
MVIQMSPNCTGIREPVSAGATGAMQSITTPGTIPASRHNREKPSMAMMNRGPFPVPEQRRRYAGRPRNTMPNARAKRAAASAAASSRPRHPRE